MPLRTELRLRLPNSPGSLASVCRVLSEARVSINALALDSTGLLRLVVDNHVHAAGALREHHHKLSEGVVLVVSASGASGVSPAARLVADAGVNVDYAYSGENGMVVLGVDDAPRAAASAGV